MGQKTHNWQLAMLESKMSSQLRMNKYHMKSEWKKPQAQHMNFNVEKGLADQK